MKIGRNVIFMVFTVFIVLIFMTALATGQEKFPSKPITVVVGYAAGGATDLSARVFSKAFEKILKQPVIAVNKPGGGGAIALQFVKNSLADGYTLGTITTGAILGGHQREVPFKIFDDFTHLCQYGEWIVGIAVHIDSSWKTLEEFVEYARKNPGKIKYSTIEKGTHAGLLAAQFGILNGIDWVPVHFPGDPQCATALLGKHVDAVVSTPQAWESFVKAGKFRLLTIFEKRFNEFHDVSTVIERGYKSAPKEFCGFVGLLAPKGLPVEVRATLLDAFRKAWKDSEFQKAMDEMMLPATYKEGDEWIHTLKEYDKIGFSIMKQVGLVK